LSHPQAKKTARELQEKKKKGNSWRLSEEDHRGEKKPQEKKKSY